MKTIRVLDKEFGLSIDAATIQMAIENMAIKINADLEGKNPLFLVVLNGAFVFAADLIRTITVDCNVTFVKLSSYSGTFSTTHVRELIGLDEDVNGRTVVVVEDIIDTGITMDNMMLKLKGMGAADVRIATFLFKPGAFRKKYPIHYVGIEIPNDFIVGYGLDYDGYGRNLPDIYSIVK
jgi:hypoxanthine phosphoribosyltransferase